MTKNNKTLPNGWQWKKLGEVTENLDGKRKPVKSSERQDLQGEYPYYGASGIIDYVNEYLFDGEFLLISEDGANLVVRKTPIAFIATGKFWVNNHAHIVNAKPKISTNKFLEYCLSNTNISDFITGSAQPKLSQGKLKEIQIPLPPLAEQKRIVAKIDAAFEQLDEAISLQKTNIARTETLKKALLVEQFSELPYKKEMLSKLVMPSKTKSPEKDKYFNYLDISAIDNKYYKITELKRILGSEAPSRARKIANQFDIVFATTRPNLKNIAIVEEKYDNLICSTGFSILSPKQSLNYKFLFYFAISDYIQEQILPFIRGAQYPAISDKDLLTCEIPLPPLAEQEKIVAYLDKSFAEIDKMLEAQRGRLAHLEGMKKAILQEAFEGGL